MRLHHQVGVHARRRWRTARSAAMVAGLDLVRRNFNPSGPNQLRAADVTQIRTGEGWLYLAAVLDLWSRRIIGWAIGPAVNTDLVGDALVMAFQRRRPDQRVVHHSDRGAAYTSLAFSSRLAPLKLDHSFSEVGSCYDNAAVESFFATLKRELAWIYHDTKWSTRAQLHVAPFDYIETSHQPKVSSCGGLRDRERVLGLVGLTGGEAVVELPSMLLNMLRSAARWRSPVARRAR